MDAISLSGRQFQLGRTALPRRLEPMARLPVRLRFTPSQAGEVAATLTVASGGRCAKLLVLGQAVSAISEDQLINHSPEVLDFGVVAPGTRVTQHILFSLQSGAEEFRPTKVSIGAINSQFFRIDPIAQNEFDDCARFQVPVTFLGSDRETTASEVIGWDVESMSNGARLVGLQLMELIATVEP